MFAAVLMAAVFLAPVAGFTHRIVHGATFLDTPAAATAPQSSLHACATFDAAALAPALATALSVALVLPGHAIAPCGPAHAGPLLAFMARFQPRAPPRAVAAHTSPMKTPLNE